MIFSVISEVLAVTAEFKCSESAWYILLYLIFHFTINSTEIQFMYAIFGFH